MIKKRMFVVIGSLDVGGTERHLCSVLPHLKDKKFDITVIGLQRRGDLAPEMEAAGIPVITPPFSPRLRFCRPLHLLVVTIWLAQVFRDRRPDIVHTFLPEAYIIAGSVSIIMGVPIRIMSRRSLNNYHSRRPFASLVERFLHRHMHTLLGNSAAIIKQLREEMGERQTKTHLIYSGLEVERFARIERRSDIRAELGIPKEAIVFAAIANLISYKGHANLLEAFEDISEKLSVQWRLICVGKDFCNDDVLYISGRQARIVRVGFLKTIFYMTDRGTKMIVPNDRLKLLVIEKKLPLNGGFHYLHKGGEEIGRAS
ncbi:MAG: glycosyltransferase, partial [Alphaproteobacteria bacterium]